MVSDLKKELEAVKGRWNYADVIALVTANLPGTTFNGDRSQWLRGIYALSTKYPQLFKGVRFRTREPFTPYSKEVDEVLKMLGRWEYRGDFNPRFRRIEMDEGGKQELRADLEPKLEEHRDEIGQMASILAGYVAMADPEGETNDEPGESQGRSKRLGRKTIR